jgi:hypothetical protein
VTARVDRDGATLACPFPECAGVMELDLSVSALPLPKHWDVLDAIAAAAPHVEPVMCLCDPDIEEHPATFHCSKCGKDFCELLSGFLKSTLFDLNLNNASSHYVQTYMVL